MVKLSTATVNPRVDLHAHASRSNGHWVFSLSGLA
jgi:hypothetical protein